MSGVRLDTRVHIITGANTALQNIQKCIQRCGLQMDQIMLQPLASGHAVLTEDEKDLGVCVIDIGGGTTDIAVYTNGAIRHTAVIPVAGDLITKDLAQACGHRTVQPSTSKSITVPRFRLWTAWMK